MVIRNLINGSDGMVREGFRSFNTSDLNAKERAEMAYTKIMADGNFLTHQGLETEYWLRGWMYEKRCDELKLSSWGKSIWSNDMFMLEVSQFKQRGRTLRVGEWRRVLAENMIFYKNKHYYTRQGELMEDFEEAVEQNLKVWAEKLGMHIEGGRVESEVIELEDLTPTGPCDSLLVAEAVINKRTPPTLLNLDDPETRGKIKGIEYGMTEYEEMELESCLGIGKGSILGNPIGAEKMKKICQGNHTGMVIIKDGVMERVLPKTKYPDVILDEDEDHFYLNGVGPKKEVKEEYNKIAFWNCNGWRGEHTDRGLLLGEMLNREGVEMICLSDTRLDELDGMRTCGTVCGQLGKLTGKSWRGTNNVRKNKMNLGGAMILYSTD
jgi:hypothetical protein